MEELAVSFFRELLKKRGTLQKTLQLENIWARVDD